MEGERSGARSTFFGSSLRLLNKEWRASLFNSNSYALFLKNAGCGGVSTDQRAGPPITWQLALLPSSTLRQNRPAAPRSPAKRRSGATAQTPPAKDYPPPSPGSTPSAPAAPPS